MTRDKLLTISLLASNRKDTIEKCLTSLKPLIEAVDSELIVIDTGCDAETRAIIERFTNQIYLFEWCNDFAKARNEGLKRARGKWFLYIDDDEWFEDVSEIIEFFLNGDFLQYHSGKYVQRNYRNFKGSKWTDYSVLRMTELNDDTKFESVIHESFNIVYRPTKIFTSYVHHYGYVFKSKEAMKKHEKRNMALLVQEYERNQSNLRIAAHFVQECMNTKNYEKVENIFKAAEEVELKGANSDLYYNALAMFAVEALNVQQEYQTEIERIHKLEKQEKLFGTTRAMMYSRGIEAAYFTEQYFMGLDFFYAYEKIKGYYDKNPEQCAEEKALILHCCFAEETQQLIKGYGILCALRAQNPEKAEEIFRLLDWEGDKMFLPLGYLGQLTAIMKTYRYEELFPLLCDSMIRRDGMQELLAEEISQQYLEAEEPERECLESNLKKLESEHWVISCVQVLGAYRRQEELDWLHYFRKIIVGTKYFLQVFEQWKIWVILEEKKVDLGIILPEITFPEWSVTLNHWISMASDREIDILMCGLRGMEEDNLYKQYLMVKVQERRLVQSYQSMSFGDLAEQLQTWAENEESFYHFIYQEKVFKQLPNMLPQECTFAIIIKDILQKVKWMGGQELAEQLRSVKNMYEPLKPVWKAFLEKLKLELSQKADLQEQQWQMRTAILNKIPILEQDNKLEEALAVINQLLQWYPGDAEINVIRERLMRRS